MWIAEKYPRLALALAAGVTTISTLLASPAPISAAVTAPALQLRVLLVGEGASDPMTNAWASTLGSEGTAYQEVDASAGPNGETVSLPGLTSGDAAGNFNGVVLAGSPTNFTAGALDDLYRYESTFGIRQVDGYMFPNPVLGATDATSGPLDQQSTATLTTVGLLSFPELKGPITFASGTYGYPATVNPGAPYAPLIANPAGQVLAGIYMHTNYRDNNGVPGVPGTVGVAADPQAGVQELSLYFNYNLNQLQWLLLAPGLIDWVTHGTHLGLHRNYVAAEVDDIFTPDDTWDATSHADNPTTPVRMSPADVSYGAAWSKASNFRIDNVFNFGGSDAYQDGTLNLTGSASTTTAGPDPLLAQYQATDPATGKSYTDDFGWLNHTYDHPYLDVGCASQNYIEAEVNENVVKATAAPGAVGGTGGLGLGRVTDTSQTYGVINAGDLVPGNHSGLASLPGAGQATVGYVDPPVFTASPPAEGGTLYDYAISDQFQPTGGESTASVVEVAVPAGATVNLKWEAVCHAADYRIYREVVGTGRWYLQGTYSPPSTNPFTPTVPNDTSADPVSTTDVSGGGEQQLTYTDSPTITGTAQTVGWEPPTANLAAELPWEQNPYLTQALKDVGVTAVGADASKAYPNPAKTQFGIGLAYSGETYAAGTSFADGAALGVPRHATNIFFNASTEAQEIDEYNTIYHTTYTTFVPILASVVAQMFAYMISNDAEPSYFHQSNLMGQPPADPSGAVPNTPVTTGDGLLYSVVGSLLAEYHKYFADTTPYVQPTLGASATVLSDQKAWSSVLEAGTVVAAEQDGTVTLTNNATLPVRVPATMPKGTALNGAPFGDAYGAGESGWIVLGVGQSLTLKENLSPAAPAILSMASAAANVGAPFSFTVYTSGEAAAALGINGTLPAGLSFVDYGSGRATIAGTPSTGSGDLYIFTISASNKSGSTTQSFALTVSEAPTITSPAGANFTAAFPGTYTVTTTGYPPTSLVITETGTLPAGLAFKDNGNGTGTVSGTPLAGAEHSYPATYPVIVSATNVTNNSTATLALTITVNKAAAAALTVPAADFTLGQAGSVTVVATGRPVPKITIAGALPTGLSFTDNHDGTALLSGTPIAPAGTYDVTLSAANGVSPDDAVIWHVVVGYTPRFTSVNSLTVVAGTPFNFSMSTDGYPPAYITATGLPGGFAIANELSADGTPTGNATILGSLGAGEIGVHTALVTADNLYGSATQDLNLVVGTLPKFTSQGTATFTEGSDNSFVVSVEASPTPSLSAAGQLPQGVTLRDHGDGTATIAGTPAKSTEGTWPIVLTAQNAVATATASFTLVVNALSPTSTSTTTGPTTTGPTTTGPTTTGPTTTTGQPAPVVPAPSTSPVPPAPPTTGPGGVASPRTTTTGPKTAALKSPSFTSSKTMTAVVGKGLSFQIRAVGQPVPVLTHSKLPAGLHWSTPRKGWATISGVPSLSSAGERAVRVVARNTAGQTVQVLTIILQRRAGIAKTKLPSIHAGEKVHFVVKTYGYPIPTLSTKGQLPKGLAFTQLAQGKATIAGTPPKGWSGKRYLNVTASNSLGNMTHHYVVTVGP